MSKKLWAIEIIDDDSKNKVAVTVENIESVREVVSYRIVTMRSGETIKTEASYKQIMDGVCRVTKKINIEN